MFGTLMDPKLASFHDGEGGMEYIHAFLIRHCSYGVEDQYIYLLYSGFLGCFLAVLAFAVPGVLRYCISDPCLTL